MRNGKTCLLLTLILIFGYCMCVFLFLITCLSGFLPIRYSAFGLSCLVFSCLFSFGCSDGVFLVGRLVAGSVRRGVVAVKVSNVSFDQSTTLVFPFASVAQGPHQMFVRGHTKDSALLQLVGQGNHIVIKEGQLTMIPKVGRIFTLLMVANGGSALASSFQVAVVGSIDFLKQTLVPFHIDLPMLHGVGHITGLNQICTVQVYKQESIVRFV